MGVQPSCLHAFFWTWRRLMTVSPRVSWVRGDCGNMECQVTGLLTWAMWSLYNQSRSCVHTKSRSLSVVIGICLNANSVINEKRLWLRLQPRTEEYPDLVISALRLWYLLMMEFCLTETKKWFAVYCQTVVRRISTFCERPSLGWEPVAVLSEGVEVSECDWDWWLWDVKWDQQAGWCCISDETFYHAAVVIKREINPKAILLVYQSTLQPSYMFMNFA